MIPRDTEPGTLVKYADGEIGLVQQHGAVLAANVPAFHHQDSGDWTVVRFVRGDGMQRRAHLIAVHRADLYPVEQTDSGHREIGRHYPA